MLLTKTAKCCFLYIFQISVNGFIVLGSKWVAAPPRPPVIPVEHSDQSRSRPRIIAPFWTDLKFKAGSSRVWYQTYYAYPPKNSTWNNNLTLIQRFKNESSELDNFEPVQAFVVTWEKMVPVDVEEVSTLEVNCFFLF